MLSPETIAHLRCPIDPARATALVLDDDFHLFCSGCRVRFPTPDNIPCMIPDDAILPAGVREIAKLPCRNRKAPDGPVTSMVPETPAQPEG